MIIEKVKLTDFLSHKDSDIQFKGTVNVIVGHNGAGKSSIIDGIMFALFRETLRNARKQEDLIKKGASSGFVVLEISDSGKKYTIRRNLSNRSSEDTLTEISGNNRRTIARSATTVTEKVKEILNLDQNTMESTIIIGQGKIENVFNDLPETIKKVLKIDKIEGLRDSRGPLKEIQDEIRLKLSTLDTIEEERKKREEEKAKKEGDVKRLKEELYRLLQERSEIETKVRELEEKVQKEEEKQKKYIEIKSQLDRTKEEIEEIEKEISGEEGLRKEKEILEGEVRKLDELRKEKEKLIEIKGKIELKEQKENSLQRLLREHSDLKTKLKRKKDNEVAYVEYLKVKEELEKIEEKENNYNKVIAQLDSLSQQIKSLKNRLDTTVREEDLTKISQEIEDMDKKYEELQEEKNNLNKQYGELRGRIEELRKILVNIDQVKGTVCPVCGRPLEESHKMKIHNEINEELNKLNEELRKILVNINKITKEINVLNAEIEKKRKQKEFLNKKITEYLNTKEQLEELENKYDTLIHNKEELEEYHRHYETLNRKIKELEVSYKEYLKYSDVDEKKIEDIENQIKILQEEVEKIKTEVGDYEKVNINVEIQKISNKINELENKEKKLKEIENNLTRIDEKKHLLVEKKEELERLNFELNILNFNEKEFKELKKERDLAVNTLNELNTKESQIRGQLVVLENDIKSLEQQIKDYEEKLKGRQKLREAYSKVDKLREALSERRLQAYLMSTVRKMVENSLNDIVAKFDLTFRMVEINFNEKNGIYAYTENGQKLSINMLSGGERVSIALALRLAIAKSLMKDVGFLILDEPTVNLDEYRKRELIDIIRSTVEVVPQIIVVTHDEELLQAADYVLRLEKRGDSSKVTEEVPTNDQGSL